MARKAKKTRTPIRPEHDYHRFPALAAYIDRIGAEQLNFKRFMVKEFKGDSYYTEKVLITLEHDFSVSVSDDKYAPSDDEAAAIKDALKESNFPTSICARNLSELKKLLPPDHSIYTFIDRRQKPGEGNIRMVQQRIINENGTKNFIPWTFFSDGEWKRMEPDGALPFWKPEKQISNRIMVHEGAKAAEFVHDLTTNPARKKELAAHPWGETFKKYEHWGLIGGALAPHRADYDELRREKPTEVVYFCDNDWNGKKVLEKFSRYYGGRLKGVMLDEETFRTSWDCADPMPPNKFADKLWLGPSLESLMLPATYATELIPPESGKGKGHHVCKREFVEEWLHCVNPEVFIHFEHPDIMLDEKGFNSAVKPYSQVDDTSRLLKSDAAGKGGTIQYHPGKPSGIYNDPDLGRCINTYKPSPFKPAPGSVEPFLKYMEALFPVAEDRHQVMRWCATLLARPDIKMHYGILLTSDNQGVGKTTLGEKILAPLIGLKNVSTPSEADITDSVYNYWIAHKRLAIINEIYQGSSAKAYNKLKSIVTDSVMTVSKKYQAPYQIDCWTHVFACSNTKRALQLAIDDRRWLVPAVTEEERTPEYWNNFNAWLKQEGGLHKILNWAFEYVEKHKPVVPGDRAPRTAAKNEAIEEGWSDGMRLVAEFLDLLKLHYEGQSLLVVDDDLVSLVRHYRQQTHVSSEHMEKPSTLRKVAKFKGWATCETRIQLGAKSNPPEWRGIKLGSRLVCSDPEDAKTDPATLMRDGRKPVNAIEVYERMKRI